MAGPVEAVSRVVAASPLPHDGPEDTPAITVSSSRGSLAAAATPFPTSEAPSLNSPRKGSELTLSKIEGVVDRPAIPDRRSSTLPRRSATINEGVQSPTVSSHGSLSPAFAAKSSRSRLQSISRASASIAYPEDHSYTSTTVSRASLTRSDSAVVALQAVAMSPTSSQASHQSDVPASASMTPSVSTRPIQRERSPSSPARTVKTSSPRATAAREEEWHRARTQSAAASAMRRHNSVTQNPYTAAATEEAGNLVDHDQPLTSYRPRSERRVSFTSTETRRRHSINALASFDSPAGYEGVQPIAQPESMVQGLATGPLEAKVVVLGAQSAGKTSLVHRYTTGQFVRQSMPSTIGASFLVKKLVVEGIACRLQIWDTAGQERFRSMAPMYYRGSNAAIIVYDITSRESFADVKSWIDELKKMTDEEDLIIHVVGCKKDLAPFGREVDREDARRQIDEWTRPPKPSPPLQPLTRPPVKPGHGSHGGSLSRLSTFASMAVRGGGSAINASVSSLTRPSTAVEVSSTSAGTGSGTAGDDMHDQDGFSRMDGVGLTEVSAKDGEGIEEVFLAITQRLVLRRDAIEQRRQARERNSIFLAPQIDEGSEDLTKPGKSSGQWSCC